MSGLAVCGNCGRSFDPNDADGCPCHGEDAMLADPIDRATGLLFKCRACTGWCDIDNCPAKEANP